MTDLLRKAAQKWRDDGLIALTRSGATLLSKHAEFARSNGVVTLSAGDKTARVIIEDTAELSHVRLFRKHELETVEQLLTDLTPTDVFYDIGANMGIYSLFAAQVCQETVAFEPHPPNADRFRQNIAKNNLTAVVRERAISDTGGTVELAASGSESPGHGTAAISMDAAETLTVPSASLDDLVAAGLPVPSVVKIDVEGAEGLVFDGMQDTLRSETCRLVYCELHHDALAEFGFTATELRQRLVDAGFAVTTLEKRPHVDHIRAER